MSRAKISVTLSRSLRRIRIPVGGCDCARSQSYFFSRKIPISAQYSCLQHHQDASEMPGKNSNQCLIYSQRARGVVCSAGNNEWFQEWFLGPAQPHCHGRELDECSRKSPWNPKDWSQPRTIFLSMPLFDLFSWNLGTWKSKYLAENFVGKWILHLVLWGFNILF